MALLKGWLLAHPAGATYRDVARATGMSPNRVGYAALDLHLFDPDLIVSVPAPKNGYTLRAGWNRTARLGEANQMRHNATRLDRQAIRCEKAARDYERRGHPTMGQWLRVSATHMTAQANELRALADALDRE